MCRLDSSCEHSAGSGRLMGGTGLLVLGDSIGRMTHRGAGGDQMGRWSYVHFKRDQLPPLTIISVYQVCSNPTNKIGSTAWHQQRRSLDLDHRHKVHPRQAFVDDLIVYVKSLQTLHHDIIVGGDWNDHIGSTNSTILRLCTTLNLTDPWMSHFPDLDTCPTYERGVNRIDSVLVSQRLIPLVSDIGYSPVGLLANSDHRSLFINLPLRHLFGTRIQLSHPSLRNVRSNDKNSVTLYVETMFDHLHEHNVFRRAKQLSADADLSSLVESIDAIVGQAGDLGEKRCRKRRPQWYSLELVQQRLTVSYLRHFLKGLQQGKDRSTVILSRLQQITSPIQVLSVSITETQALLTHHEALLKTTALTSRDGRTKHLTSLSSPQSTRINKHEIALSTWRTLAFIKGRNNASTLDQLEIPFDWPPAFTSMDDIPLLSDPKDANTWRCITSPPEIEYYLQIRNRLHFGQAAGTPFTMPDMTTALPWTSHSGTAEAILSGTYIPPSSMDSLVSRVLCHCRRVHLPDAIAPTVTVESFRGKMRKWRESTTTSPSGRHLGRYKALFAKSNIDDNDSEAVDAFTVKQQAIVSVILSVINYCIRTGHVLNRWKVVVNTMIFKDPGCFRIHRLRVLHIYEADFNLILAVKWRELLRVADARGQVNINQHGARPGCEAASLALCEEFRSDVAYSSRRTLISVDNDAASCFDRMLPPLVTLNNRTYGLPQELARLHGATLQAMKYHLRTSIGISDMSYSHSDSYPIFGTGQGSGNSPVVWLLLSATLFDIHTSLAHGAEIQDPTGQLTLHVSISGFVDDTNACINAWHPQHDGKLDDIMSKVQHDAQLWNDLLYVSGGKLELTKCSYHPLRFKFSADGAPTVDPILPPPIRLVDSVTQSTVHVPALPPYAPHKTLGHWKAPAGVGTTQLKTLQAKMQMISIRIATSSLSRYGARLAYHALYVAVLRYVLPQCHFQPKVLITAEKKSLPTLYAKCGFSRKTPQALLFAPREYGGGGFVHWDSIQGEGQILHFMKHWRTATVISTTLRISVAWCQWQAGISQSILIHTAALPYLESRWLPSLREAMHSRGVTIRTDDTTFVPRGERDDDVYIMDVILASKDFTPKDVRILNYCRLYLHITTISEMYDSDGTNLLPHILRCTRSPWFDPTVNVAIQRRPSDFQIRTRWNRFCQMATHIRVKGPWVLPLRLRRETYCLAGSDASLIYHWYAGSYWTCSSPRVVDGQFRLTLLRPTGWLPGSSSDVPVCIISRVHRTIYTRITTQSYQLPILQASLRASDGSTFDAHVQSLSSWCQTLLQHVTWICPLDYVLQALTTMPDDLALLVVSDGSAFEGQHMSFGVTIGLMDGRVLVEIMGPGSGQPSSHRAECMGCLAGALFCAELQQFSSLSFRHLTLTVVSDNQGMIRSLTERASYDIVYPNSTLRPDWDVLEEIHLQFQRFEYTKLSFEWEKGHQDVLMPHHELTPRAVFNVRSDALAATYTNTYGKVLTPLTPLYESTRCHLEIHGMTITGNIRQALRLAATEPPLFAYLMRKHAWDDDVLDDVDWDSFCLAARTYNSTEVHLLKLVHDKLPMRHHVARHQNWTHPECYYCDQHDTMDHLQLGTCNPASIRYRHDISTKIRRYLIDRRCPSLFSDMFMQSLEHWINHVCLPAPVPVQFHGQGAIGWRLLTRGFLTRTWRILLTDALVASPDLSVDAESFDVTRTLAGLIKVMWECLSCLWIDHLQTVHERSSKKQSPVTLESCKNQVRLIHALKPATLPIHSHYFHDDLERVLHKATLQSLQLYIQHYLPVIKRSMTLRLAPQPNGITLTAGKSGDAACTVPHGVHQGSLLTGRPRHRTGRHAPGSLPLPPSATSASVPVSNAPPGSVAPFSPISHGDDHPAQAEPTHRKHSRRRILRRLRQVLGSWAQRFRSPPPPT